ncbi:hypothetical protein K9M09_01500 [Patescibacteria group bacterium]|nr:hypothetical protein [Patescibacteria group bacterium]
MKEALVKKMNVKNAFEIGGIVLGHELIEKALNSVLDGAKKHGGDFLKSSFMGLGTDDEALFNSAIAYAVFGLKVDPAKMMEVLQVINSFPRPSKLRIIQIIGKDEQEVHIEIPSMDGDVVRTDKKGKVVFEKTVLKANVRGGQTLQLWSTLTKENIKLAVEAGNMDNPMGDKIAEFVSVDNLLKGAKAIAKAADSSYKATKNGFDAIGNDLVKPNAISRFADKFRKNKKP